MNAQTVGVLDLEDVQDVLVAAHRAEHLGDVRGVAGPRVGEQLVAERRALEWVQATGGVSLLFEVDRVVDWAMAAGARLQGRVGGGARATVLVVQSTVAGYARGRGGRGRVLMGWRRCRSWGLRSCWGWGLGAAVYIRRRRRRVVGTRKAHGG
ncbi:hypothetical protein GCM10023178_18140 [Actinomadura luteofluorescens]